jgi:hypothetical protein
MKQLIINSVLAVVMTALVTGCSESSVTKITNALLGKEEKEEAIVPEYNIVLIADGTDIRHNHYAVPVVTREYISNLANKIQHNGKGRLWLGYVDNSSENNNIAYLEIFPVPNIVETAIKKRSETKAEYDARLNADKERFAEVTANFEQEQSKRISMFLAETQQILEIAYSDKVATAKAGSDVNGAINAGSRLLNLMPNDTATKNYIVLVSDGVDNIKNGINRVQDNVEVLLVNNSGSKNHLGIKVVELDNLIRVEEYIFSNK